MSELKELWNTGAVSEAGWGWENGPVFRKGKELRLHGLQSGQFDINTYKTLENTAIVSPLKGKR